MPKLVSSCFVVNIIVDVGDYSFKFFKRVKVTMVAGL